MSYFGGIGLLYAPKKSCLSVTSKSSVPIFDAVCARVLICVFVCMCVCVGGVGWGGWRGSLPSDSEEEIFFLAGKGRALKCLGDELIHSVHWGIDPSPSKKSTPLFFAKPPPLNLQTVQAPLFPPL